MAEKTMAEKILTGKSVSYEVLKYPATLTDAVAVAGAVGVAPSSVYKTLVATRQAGKAILVMIPADHNLNLKKLAKVVGEKKVSMARHSEAEKLTRLQVGGISALALLNRGFDIYIDSSASQQEKICVSAGKRGLQIRLEVNDLITITKAKVVDVSE